MDNEGLFDLWNDDCIFQLLRFMNIASILMFGCTNIRHRALVSNFIARRQYSQGNIQFVLNYSMTIMREILLRLGANFVELDVNFGRELIDMDLFQDPIEGCLLNNAQELNLRANVNETMMMPVFDDDDDDDARNIAIEMMDAIDGYGNFGNIDELLERFQLNSTNVINSINNNEIPTLRHVTFNFCLVLTPYTYNDMESWLLRAQQISQDLFSYRLRRGHMHLTHATNHQTLSVVLTLEILLY